jgi:ABC-2 type transport system permease protein
MNIFLRELKANFKSLLIWSGITILFTIVGFAKFSAYYGNPDMLAILDGMPTAMLDALNMNAFNLTTVTGFFGIMFIYFALLLTIAAAMWGSDVISKEERDKTVEFSLVLPVTRSQVITGKALAVLVNCIVLNLITWGFTIANAQQYTPDDKFNGFVAITMLSLFIMQMIFLAVGILLGSALKQYKRAGSIGVSIILATYFISIFTSLNKDLDFLKYFSPFTYFNPANMLHDLTLEPGFVLLSAGIVAVALVAAYLAYSKRDLYI